MSSSVWTRIDISEDMEMISNILKASKTIVISVLACLTLGLHPLSAQQRMGIARGSFELAGNSAESIPTYCLDLTRESPHVETQYQQILTSPGAAHVTVNGTTMALQEALDRHWISIEGQDPTLGQFIDMLNDPIALQRMRLTQEQKSDAQQLSQLWRQATAEERK